MLAFGLQVTVIGFSIVIIALAALMFVIQGGTGLFQKKTDTPKVNTAPQAAPAAAPVEATPVKKDDNELTAVIAAAIAACGHQVVVKSITRVMGTNGAAWSAIGRTEAMNLRQL